MATIHLGTRDIGTNTPCFIAAEIGINHNGDMDLARRMVDAAAECGVDAVKFQNYRTEEFLSDKGLTYTYVSQGETVTESQWDMFKRCELSSDSLVMLAEHCRRRGLVFFSTPCSRQGIADCLRAGASLLKNGSDFLTHLPLIREMARTGLPTALSLGMASEEDITDAVTAFKQAGGRNLILLHCTSAYPTPPEDANLLRIPALAERYDVLAGYSDHTEGVLAAVGAVSLGACFIEKHFTLDKSLPGPDHRFSSDSTEMRSLVASVRTMEKALGSCSIGPAASELAGRRDFRLSCSALRDLRPGDILHEADIAIHRPGTGLSPKEIERFVGTTLRRAVPAKRLFSPEDFDAA